MTAGDAPPPKPTRSWTPLLTAAVSALAALGLYEMCSLRPSTSLEEQREQKSEAASRVRLAARTMCERERYIDCLRMYDQAKRLDPEGDKDREVQADQRAALAALDAGRTGRPAPEADSTTD